LTSATVWLVTCRKRRLHPAGKPMLRSDCVMKTGNEHDLEAWSIRSIVASVDALSRTRREATDESPASDRIKRPIEASELNVTTHTSQDARPSDDRSASAGDCAPLRGAEPPAGSGFATHLRCESARRCIHAKPRCARAIMSGGPRHVLPCAGGLDHYGRSYTARTSHRPIGHADIASQVKDLPCQARRSAERTGRTSYPPHGYRSACALPKPAEWTSRRGILRVA